MKRLHFILLSITFTFLSFSTAYTQIQSDKRDVRISVSAEIIDSSIEMITINQMDFGSVQPSQGVIQINPAVDSNAGKLKAEGSPNVPIRISFQQQLELVHMGGNSTLTFFYDVAGSSEDNQSTSEILEPDSRELRLNDEGEFYFWVGGRVDITNAVNGQYEGEFTVEVENI